MNKSDVRIELRQVEKADTSAVRDLLNSPLGELMNVNRLMSIAETNDFISDYVDNGYLFIISAIRNFKSFTVGFCGIKNISWINRKADLVFLMIDEDKHAATLQNKPLSLNAFYLLLKFGFERLNLNKLTICVTQGNNVADALERFGFVAEGVRRAAVYKNGKYLSETVCSKLALEWFSDDFSNTFGK